MFDAKGKTFRDDIYPEYKANRASMPDDLRLQIEPLFETIRAMGWPLIIEEGVEADDVIGALAKQAEREGISTIISTGDKDISQLVNQHITVVNTMRDAFRKTDDILDIAGVENKFCIPPERMIDYLVLIGDTSDNVPGVEKVGHKTAVKWLKEYGSLENIVANADKITGVVGENLRRALPWLPTARELITIRCDVGIREHFDELIQRAPDKAKLAELFDRFEFRSWKRELENMGQPVGAPPSARLPEHRAEGGAPTNAFATSTRLTPHSSPLTRIYTTILTEDALNAWLTKLEQAQLICLDTETTSLDPLTARLVGMSFSVESG